MKMFENIRNFYSLQVYLWGCHQKLLFSYDILVL